MSKLKQSQSVFQQDGRSKSCLCCCIDVSGDHRRLKEIRNIKPDGFSNMFVCSGQHLEFKLFHSSQTDYRVFGSSAVRSTATKSAVGGSATNLLLTQSGKTSHCDRGTFSILSRFRRQCQSGISPCIPLSLTLFERRA